MLKFLTNPNQNKVKYVLKAVPLTLTLAVLSALLVFSTFDPQGKEDTEEGIVWNIIGSGIVAPLVETLLMIPIFEVLKKISKEIFAISILSAIIWGLLHSLLWIPWGAIIFLPFVVLSLSFQVWSKESLKSAFWVTSSIHCLHNLSAVLLCWILEKFYL